MAYLFFGLGRLVFIAWFDANINALRGVSARGWPVLVSQFSQEICKSFDVVRFPLLVDELIGALFTIRLDS